jgi:hypothetical protein
VLIVVRGMPRERRRSEPQMTALPRLRIAIGCHTLVPHTYDRNAWCSCRLWCKCKRRISYLCTERERVVRPMYMAWNCLSYILFIGNCMSTFIVVCKNSSSRTAWDLHYGIRSRKLRQSYPL